ncbi:hypothetical protein KKE78_02455 [Patescibacteria group bacterium]|nr:hypothetical protein [Patescibacteria group bacterium]
MENKPEIRTEPTTIKGLLESAVEKTKRLHEEAYPILWEQLDSELYLSKLKERAKVIIDIPNKVDELVERGEMIPKHELIALQNLAFMAKEAIDKNNDFHLGVLLIDRGSRDGDPNQLERILQRLYPPKST